MRNMAVTGEHRIDAEFRDRNIAENLLDPAGGKQVSDDEIRLQRDAQTLRRALTQHVAVVGVDPAA